MADFETANQPLHLLAAAVRRTGELTRGRAPTGRSHDEADDTIGTIGTDDALGFDPFALLRALHEAGAPVTVIGQVAGIMHGSDEPTGDLDLLWDGEPAHGPALAAAFRSVGADLAAADGAPVPCAAPAFELPKVLFSSPHASGDCCTPALPWGDLPIADFLARAVLAVSADGIEVRYLAREDLIRMRRAAGRPKDHRRADELERRGAGG